MRNVSTKARALYLFQQANSLSMSTISEYMSTGTDSLLVAQKAADSQSEMEESTKSKIWPKHKMKRIWGLLGVLGRSSGVVRGFFLVVLLFCLAVVASAQPQGFSSANETEIETITSSSYLPWSFYDELRMSNTATSTPLGFDNENDGPSLLVISDESKGVSADESVTLCHVPMFFRYTDRQHPLSDDFSSEMNSDALTGAYSNTVAAMLAIHHFNTGDGSIVEELIDMHEWCPVSGCCCC
jgi:hypothetical protein